MHHTTVRTLQNRFNYVLHTHCTHVQQLGFVYLHFVHLGGLVVIVLAIGPEVRGFKPGREKWTLRAIKITSFGEEVKPSTPCRNILRHVKDLYSMKEILVGKIHGHFSPSFFLLPC
jgi:hypothetical protein